MKKVFYFLIFAVAAFTSCTKDIDVNVPDYTQKLVVEGGIEPGSNPYVYLSWTLPYFGNNDYSDFQQYMVKGAVVTVSDGFTTDTLKEVIPGQGLYYLGLNMQGVTGRTYDLNILINGKTYTSSTTINLPVPLDSLWFKPEKDSLGFVWTHFKEPAGLGHRYRWYAKRIGKDDSFYAPFSSVFDDKFIDGKEFDFAYDRGMKPNSEEEDDKNVEKGYFKVGDTVVVKYCTIGDKEFRYLRSYYLNQMSNGNPFAAPSTLESNISGDAIGLWCGYGVFTKGVRLKMP
ncbi:MAG: DUF4249 domain-containing protein [Bacteroidia bacterium]|nr:DUF4249 domain-containing protein [Bacteroidia bacterium]